MAFDFRYPNADAESRGWGKGWPVDRRGDMAPLTVAGAIFLGGVHRDIVELCGLVLGECAARGYVFHQRPQQNWGYAGRFTKRSDGSQTTTPSNHSWGLAVDINSAVNVYGGDHFDYPGWMPPFLKTYGFRWLGPPIKDQQHFDFCGEPADAKRMTEKARAELATDPADKAEIKRLGGIIDAMTKALGANNDLGMATRVGTATKKVESGAPMPNPNPPAGEFAPKNHHHQVSGTAT